MAASTAKGTLITNFEASPQVQATKGHIGGDLKVSMVTESIATTSIDEQDDIFLALPLRSDARLISLKLFNDDLDSDGSPALAVDVGLYYSSDVSGQSSGTAIDVDAFASAITTLQAANTAGVEILFEAQNITSIGKPLYEFGGLSADTGGTYYIGFKVTTAAATAAAGDITLVAQYV